MPALSPARREAAVRDTIGWTYETLGHFADAERHLRDAVRIRIDSLGRDHRSTLRSRNSLGVVLADQGKLEEARKLLEQTLAARKRVLGPARLARRVCRRRS